MAIRSLDYQFSKRIMALESALEMQEETARLVSLRSQCVNHGKRLLFADALGEMVGGWLANDTTADDRPELLRSFLGAMSEELGEAGISGQVAGVFEAWAYIVQVSENLSARAERENG